MINALKAELNPVCHLLALLGAHLIFHFSRIRVKYNFYVKAVVERVLITQETDFNEQGTENMVPRWR